MGDIEKARKQPAVSDSSEFQPKDAVLTMRDSIQSLLKSQGRAKTQQCVDVLDKAQKLFTAREEELIKDHKAFTKSEADLGGAAMKIAMCSPSEFKIREAALRGYGIGNGYYMGPVVTGSTGSGMMSPGVTAPGVR